MESFAESRHEDVQVGVQCAQVVEGVQVDLLQQIRVEAVRVHVFWTNRENSVGDWDVDVGGVFDKATRKKF